MGYYSYSINDPHIMADDPNEQDGGIIVNDEVINE